METTELASLRFFDETEQYTNGMPVDWSLLSYPTMFWLDQLRGVLEAPVFLIYNPKHLKTNRVDACCPGRTLRRVFMDLTRLPGVSWGVYTGNSFHVDTREYRYLPARWMGIRPTEVLLFKERGFGSLITESKPGSEWVYLAWSDDRSEEALDLVFALAERRLSR